MSRRPPIDPLLPDLILSARVLAELTKALEDIIARAQEALDKVKKMKEPRRLGE
jgi:hypothetical protein